MSEPSKKDGDFEAYLDGKSPLSKHYAALNRQDPPAGVDEKILAQAREASKLVHLKRPMGRWIPALAVAATLMLCVSLVLNLSIQPTGPLTDANVSVAEYKARDSDTFSTDGERADSMAAPPAADIAVPRRDRPESLPSAPRMAREEPPLEEQVLDDADFSAPTMAAENSVTLEPARPELPAGRAKREAEARSALSMGSSASATDANPMQAPRDDDVLLQAMAMLREDFSTADSAAAPLSKQAAPRKQVAAAVSMGEAGDPIDRLTEILSAYDADDPDTAWQLLMAFKLDFPEHPASLRLEDMQQEE